MGTPRVLLIEDETAIHRLFKVVLGDKIILLSALTRQQGEDIFAANCHDISLVVMDACVPGREINTFDLTKFLRLNFDGPMLASSSREDYNDLLMDAGCNFKTAKPQLLEKVTELLHV